MGTGLPVALQVSTTVLPPLARVFRGGVVRKGGAVPWGGAGGGAAVRWTQSDRATPSLFRAWQ